MQEISEPEHDNIAEEAMQGMGMSEGEEPKASPEEELPEFAKKRLGRQEKRHKRELREMQQQLQQLMQSQQQSGSPQMQQQMSQPEMGGQEDAIHRAVAAALQAKDQQTQQMQDAEKAAHVHKQYRNLENHLDSAADKYEDFDEVVRGNDVPFTPAIRDAALLIDNPGDVLYKLGKNPDELKRISNLHPLDQAKEMVKLSIALMGNSGKNGSNPPKTIGQIKNTPVSSTQVNDNTSPAEIRQRMKSGNWK